MRRVYATSFADVLAEASTLRVAFAHRGLRADRRFHHVSLIRGRTTNFPRDNALSRSARRRRRVAAKSPNVLRRTSAFELTNNRPPCYSCATLLRDAQTRRKSINPATTEDWLHIYNAFADHR
jgi:hypothetical protein